MGDALARKHARTPSLDRPPGRPLTSILSSVRPSSAVIAPLLSAREGRRRDGRTDELWRAAVAGTERRRRRRLR